MTRAVVVWCCLSLALASGASAQVCLEMPIAPAGWGVELGLARTGGATVSPEEVGGAPEAAWGLEARIGRDGPGPYSGSLGWSYAGYERLAWDPQAGEEVTWSVSNHTISGRVALPMGTGAMRSCPILELGGFLADVATPHDLSTKGLMLVAGWGLEYAVRTGRTTVVPFVTPRLMILATRGTGEFDHYPYDGNEMLPKAALRVGASVALRTFFVTADLDVILPGGDPRFWLRHATADHRAATRFGLRGGLAF